MADELRISFSDPTDLKAKLLAHVAAYGIAAGGGTPLPPPSGGTDTPPPPAAGWTPDPSLPLAMPATYAAGASIVLGTPGPGKKRLEIFLNGNPNNPVGAVNYIMPTVSDGKQLQPCLDTPWKILSRTGETKSGAMNLVIYAALPDYSQIQLGLKAAGGDGGIGIDNLCFQGATLDYQDLVGNGNWTGHADQAQVNGKAFDVFNGQDILLTAPITAANPGSGSGGGTPAGGYVIPPQTAQASIVSGAKINGAVAADTTVALLLASVPDNGTLEFPAGNFIGSGHLTAKNATVLGAGGAAAKRAGKPQTILNCTGFRPFQDKATIVVDGDNCTIKSLALTGAAIGDALGANAAGIRNGDNAGVNSLTIQDVEDYGNEDGILTQPINLTTLDNWFHDNGVPSTSARFGYDHDVYENGTPTTVITSKRNVYEKALCAHGLKCRAGTLNSEDDVFVNGGNGAGLDMPDGGVANLLRPTFRFVPGAGPTNNLFTFALESALNAAAGMVANLTDPTWDDATGQAILAGGNGAKLNITGNAVYLNQPPNLKGWDAGNVTGTFVKAP